MAHGVVILECPRTPQLEVLSRSYGVLSGALPRYSAQLCDCCGEGQHNPGSDTWEPRSLGGASEESIGIYTKGRCQWSGCLIHLELEPRRYG